MKISRRVIVSTMCVALYAQAAGWSHVVAQEEAAPQTAVGMPGGTILDRTETAKILPQTVFYRGQTAPVEGRNSAGLKLPDGKLVLATMVDASGYASAVQQTYQAYLLTEVPLELGGHRLAPGAYGFGFVAGDRMVLMDIGGNQVLQATTTRDDKLARPTPLQILPGPDGVARLYLGRSYVAIRPAER